MLHFCPVLRQKPPGRWDFTFSSRRHESVFTISGYTIISPRGKVKALPLPPPERMIERMEKENKWEYDYSSLYNTSSDRSEERRVGKESKSLEGAHNVKIKKQSEK